MEKLERVTKLDDGLLISSPYRKMNFRGLSSAKIIPKKLWGALKKIWRKKIFSPKSMTKLEALTVIINKIAYRTTHYLFYDAIYSPTCTVNHIHVNMHTMNELLSQWMNEFTPSLRIIKTIKILKMVATSEGVRVVIFYTGSEWKHNNFSTYSVCS